MTNTSRYARLLLALSHTWVWRRLMVWRSHLAILVLSVLAVVFALISYDIHRPDTQRLDFTVTRWMQAHHQAPINAIALDYTFLGNTQTLILFGVVTVLALLNLRNPRAAALSAFSLIGLPLNYALKGLFDRPRPDASVIQVIGPALGFSYPSGHAMACTAFYGFLAVLVWIHAPTARLRFYGVVGFGATALMVSASRVYLGAHWMSDVLGGMTAGLFLLVLLTLYYRNGIRPTRSLAAKPS